MATLAAQHAASPIARIAPHRHQTPRGIARTSARNRRHVSPAPAASAHRGRRGASTFAADDDDDVADEGLDVDGADAARASRAAASVTSSLSVAILDILASRFVWLCCGTSAA
jgi:hypothetical protein